MSILLYGCTTWTLTKHMDKKLDNYTRFCKLYWTSPGGQHPTKQQLYSHLPLISKTIQVRRTRHAGHCWRSQDELISNVLLWNPSHGRAKAEWPARTYIQQLSADTGYSLEDRLGAVGDKDGQREIIREVSAGSVTWWWWYVYIYIYTYMQMNINTHTHLYIHKHACTHTHYIYIYIYTHIYAHTHAHTHTFKDTHIYKNTHTQIYIYICTHTNNYTYIYIYIYIYIYTQTQSGQWHIFI